MKLSTLAFVCGPSSPVCPLPSSQPLAPMTNTLGPFRSTRLYPVGHKDPSASAALSFLPTAPQSCSGSRRAHISRNFLPVSSSKLTTQLPVQAEKCPEAPQPDPPARTPPSCTELLFLSVRDSATHLEGKFWPQGVSIYHHRGRLQAASDRQTITLALRPGSHGLCWKQSWSRVFPPHEDSLRVFYFSVKTGDWNEVTWGHDLNHTTVMRCFWCGVNSTTRQKPTLQRGKVPGARGTCWTTPLTFPISEDESAGPLLTAAQESLISLSASKWPTPWLKHDSDFNHCFCSSPEKTLYSN